MNKTPKITSVLGNDGVCAVVTKTTSGTLASEGPDHLVELGAWAIQGFDLAALDGSADAAAGDSARYIVGSKLSVLLERGASGSVALVLVQGHPIVKSARRLARALLKSILPAAVVAVVARRPKAATSPNIAGPN